MTDLHIPDVSKWQSSVDFSKVGAAIILRAHSGRGTDRTLSSRQVLARKHCRVVGYYGYVVPDRDAAAQGREFAAAVGSLLPGEFAVCDLEEGTGDQSGRAEAWCAAVDRALGGRAWIYTGLAFRQAHLSRVSGRHFWIAAYRATEPAGDHVLWQHADNHDRPGIGPCDCSVFHGTVEQLRTLITGPSTPVPAVHVPPAPAAPAAPAAPVSPPPLRGPDMIIVYVTGGATALLTGGRLYPLEDNTETDALKAAGVPVQRITAARFAKLDAVSQRITP